MKLTPISPDEAKQFLVESRYEKQRSAQDFDEWLAMCRDAERYRWLRKAYHDEAEMQYMLGTRDDDGSENAMDAAIDRAMNEKAAAEAETKRRA